MRHVFTNSEVPTVWLKQQQQNGRGSNIFFEGDTLYSWGKHFTIAKIATARNGEAVIFMTDASNSTSTNRHISYTRQAIRNTQRRVVYCNDPSATNDQTSAFSANLSVMKRELDAVAAQHNKARKPMLYAGKIMSLVQKARIYCEVLQLKVPTWALIPDGIEAGKALTAAMKVHEDEN